MWWRNYFFAISGHKSFDCWFQCYLIWNSFFPSQTSEIFWGKGLLFDTVDFSVSLYFINTKRTKGKDYDKDLNLHCIKFEHILSESLMNLSVCQNGLIRITFKPTVPNPNILVVLTSNQLDLASYTCTL